MSTEWHGVRLMARIAVPNKEVTFIYDAMVEDWSRRHATLDTYDKFVSSLATGGMEAFKKCLSDYLMDSGSYLNFNRDTPERTFQVFMLGLVVGLKAYYDIKCEAEAGLGRCDIVFIPKTAASRRGSEVTDIKRPGILLEFKACKESEQINIKAEEALQQIKDQKYVQILKQHGATEALAVGLVFCGKQVELASEHLAIS